jgi:hypothetical protein
LLVKRTYYMDASALAYTSDQKAAFTLRWSLKNGILKAAHVLQNYSAYASIINVRPLFEPQRPPQLDDSWQLVTATS